MVKGITNSKSGSVFLRLGIVALLLILTFAAEPCVAAEVWSDNFDDGNHDSWTFSSCSAADGTVRVMAASGSAYRESAVDIGTWSFDLEHKGFDVGDIDWGWQGFVLPAVFFMSSHPEETPWNYYCVVAAHVSTSSGDRPVVELRKNSPSGGGAFYTWVKLASYDLEIGDFGWKHFDVARTSNGQITVWVNGTQVIQVVDTDLESSEYFVFMAGPNRGLDNIVADDVPISTGVPLELLALGIGVPVIIVGTVVWTRRRGT